jgi:nitrous oxide reductase accessory protein NosL
MLDCKYRSNSMCLKTTRFIAITVCAWTVILTGIMFMPSIASDLLDLPDGSQLDLGEKCPVCGMIVGGPDAQGVTFRYTKGRLVRFEGVAATVFTDGKVVGFDGARCLFVYTSIPSKSGVDIADMKHQFVTDFVSKKMIPVEKAFLVLGSSVKGRMGYEMIPFAEKQQALDFASTYDGRWVIQLYSVVQELKQKKEKTEAN